jgi:hypothetical protein
MLALLAVPSVALAQWTPVGKTTRDGSALFVRQSSIRRGGDTVTALVLTRFAQPTFDPVRKDTLRALTTMATFDCKREKVKVTESVYYVNFDKNRVASRNRPKTPGWGAVFGAAFPIVYEHLCKAK